MKSIKTLALAVTVLIIGGSAISATETHAGSYYSEQIKSIDIDFGASKVIIPMKNISNDKYVNNVVLKPDGTHVNIPVTGGVWCAQDKRTTFREARAYFGPLLGGGNQMSTSSTLYNEIYQVAFHEWTGSIKKWINEAGYDDIFSVPLSKIKNGSSDTKIDPQAEMEKKLQAHLQGGGTRLSFYKNNQEVTLSRTIAIAGWCKKDPVFGGSTIGLGYKSKNLDFVIRYTGDKSLTNQVQLNAQLGQNLPNQIQAGDQPFKIVTIEFQPNMPHYIGVCAASQTIRVNYIGQGRGELKVRVNDGSETIYQSNKIPFDSNNGSQYHDFNIDVPKASKFDLNKTVAHNLKVYVQGKDENEQIWPTNWQYKDAKTWNHRCTPKVNVGTGGMGGINSNNDTPKAKFGTIKKNPDNPKSPKFKANAGSQANQAAMGKAPSKSKPKLRILARTQKKLDLTVMPKTFMLGSKKYNGNSLTIGSEEASSKVAGLCVYRMKFQIKNIGDGKAQPKFTTRTYAGNTTLNMSNTPSLAAGKPKTISGSIKLKPGKQLVIVKVDHAGKVTESKENNNMTRFNIEVKGSCGKATPPRPTRKKTRRSTR